MIRVGVSVSSVLLQQQGETIAAAIARVNALAPTCFCLAGPGATRVTVDEGNAEGGTRITTWLDLSGNGNDGTETTDEDQPELVTANGAYAMRLDKDDGTGGDGFDFPNGLLSGLTEATVFLVGGKTNASTQQTILSADDTDFKVRHVSGTTLAWYIGGAGNNVLVTDNGTDPRLYCLVFDGVGADNPERARVRIDKAWRDVTYTGTIPAAIPAITTGCRFGGWGGAEPSEGDWNALIVFDVALTEEQIQTVESALRTLVAWVSALPNPNTALSESFETITDDSAATETATGHTLTVGTPVQVIAGSGGVHRAFPGAINLGGANIRVGYRKATTHAYDADASLAYKDSADDGATFGSEVPLHDTAGVDDREVRFWEWDSDLYLGTYLHDGAAFQAYAGQIGGALENVAGFVLDKRARVHTNRPVGYDVDKYVINGGQVPFTGIGTVRRLGLVDKTSAPGSIRWLEHDTVHLDESSIVRLDASTLVMVSRAQTLADYTVTTNLRLLRTTDNEATWTCHDFSFVAAGPTLYYHAASGLLFCGFREVADGGTNIYPSVIWSADLGLTWSTVTRLTGNLGNDSGYLDFAATSDPAHVVAVYYSSSGVYAVDLEIDAAGGAGDLILGTAGLVHASWDAGTNYDPDDAGTARMVDLSAAGNDLTRTAGASAPTYNATDNALDFNGSQVLSNSALAAYFNGDSQPVTVGVEVDLDAIVNLDRIIGVGDNGASGTHWWSLGTDTTNIEVNEFDGTGASGDVNAASTTGYHRIWVRRNGTTFDAWYDGTKVVAGATVNRGSLTLTEFTLMGLLRNSGTLSGGTDGKVRALVVIDGAALSDAEIEALDADMANLP